MSLIVAPEAVAVVTPPIVVRPTAPRPDTRPVEPSDQANAGTTGNGQSNTGRSAADKPEPSERPPGTDPSMPPQSLLNASLISEDFKPATRQEDMPTRTELAPEQDAGRTEHSASSQEDTASRGEPAAFEASEDAGRAIGTRRIAEYHRVGGGSPLNASSDVHPDWLNVVEKTA